MNAHLPPPWPPTLSELRQLPEVPDLRTWTYRTWSGSDATVTADKVTFEHGYVVFRDVENRIVLAEDHANVSRLSEHDIDPAASAKRRLPIGDDQ